VRRARATATAATRASSTGWGWVVLMVQRGEPSGSRSDLSLGWIGCRRLQGPAGLGRVLSACRENPGRSIRLEAGLCAWDRGPIRWPLPVHPRSIATGSRRRHS
jgi:hypothetical protein